MFVYTFMEKKIKIVLITYKTRYNYIMKTKNNVYKFIKQLRNLINWLLCPKAMKTTIKLGNQRLCALFYCLYGYIFLFFSFFLFLSFFFFFFHFSSWEGIVGFCGCIYTCIRIKILNFDNIREPYKRVPRSKLVM